MKYFYFKCKTCNRCFRVKQAGGRNVTCPCGEEERIIEVMKMNYTEYLKEQDKLCKVT